MVCGSVLLSGCAVAGNFCDIAEPDVYATPAVVEYMVTNDRRHVEKDLSENSYGVKYCGWGKVVPQTGD